MRATVVIAFVLHLKDVRILVDCYRLAEYSGPVYMLLIRCLLVLSLFVGFFEYVLSLFYYAVIGVYFGRESWLICFRYLLTVMWLLVYCVSSSRCLGLFCSV